MMNYGSILRTLNMTIGVFGVFLSSDLKTQGVIKYLLTLHDVLPKLSSDNKLVRSCCSWRYTKPNSKTGHEIFKNSMAG